MRYLPFLASILLLGACQRSVREHRAILFLDVEASDVATGDLPAFKWRGRRVPLPVAILIPNDADSSYSKVHDGGVFLFIGDQQLPIDCPVGSEIAFNGLRVLVTEMDECLTTIMYQSIDLRSPGDESPEHLHGDGIGDETEPAFAFAAEAVVRMDDPSENPIVSKLKTVPMLDMRTGDVGVR